MADQNIHLKQAEHNRKIAKKLAKDKIRDWSVTSAFYSALHYIEASFISNPKVGHTEAKFNSLKLSLPEETKNKSLHAFRDLLIKQSFPKIRLSFAQLRHMSESARYIEKSNNKSGFDFITDENTKKALCDLDNIKSETQGC